MRFMWIPVLLATYFLSEYITDLMAPPEGEAQMANPWWLVIAGVQAGVGVYNAWQGNKAADRADKRADTQYAHTDDAIRDLQASYGGQSPGQLEYMDRLREQMEKGSLPVSQMISAVSQTTNEQANVASQRVRGEAYSSGVGGAASASAVGRVQAKALQAIAEQSRAITIENALTKDLASDKLGAIGLGETTDARNLALGIANLRSGQGAALAAGQNAADMTRYSANVQGAQGVADAFGTYASGSQYSNLPQAPPGMHYEIDGAGRAYLVDN